VLFKSAKGWYMLSRDLSVKYVGGPVARFDDDTVTSVVMAEDRQEVRVSSSLTAAAGYYGGVQLTYSYVSDTWSVAYILTDSDPLYAQSGLVVRDAAWWATLGRYVTVGLVDGLNVDLPPVVGQSQYYDAVGTAAAFPVSMSARTSFLPLGGLEGFQRVRWLYLTMSSPSLLSYLTITVDFDDLYATTNPPGSAGCYSTTPALLSSIAFRSPAAIDVRHKMRRQKCKSVAFTISESPTEAGFAGITGFEALALQVGVKRGTNKLPAAQGVG
jgi:hypothetical protein